MGTEPHSWHQQYKVLKVSNPPLRKSMLNVKMPGFNNFLEEGTITEAYQL